MKSLETHLKLLIAFSILFFTTNLYAQLPTDCIDSVIVCGNSNVNLDVSGPGTQELNNSNTCGSFEHNSIWLQVTLVTDGTLGFTLRPNSNSIQEDYDFFVFGPNVPCNDIGQSIRCSTTNPAAAGLGTNLTGMNGSSTATSEGPGPQGSGFIKWLDVSAGDTYFIVIDRPIGNSGFTLEWTGSAQFSSPPVNQASPLAPLDLEQCDSVFPYGNGFTDFNFDANTSRIRGTQTDVSISYHLNMSDANINLKALPTSYTNISNPQKIFVRITNDITGCFEIVDFSLNVNSPGFQKQKPLKACDSTTDGNSNNGRTYFDLESRNLEILQGHNPSSIITYHESQAFAENGSGALSSPYYNIVPHQQQLFVRIEDALYANCRSITTLDLVINPLPIAFDYALIQCDEDGISDGYTIFNLHQAKDAITGGSADRTLNYFLSSIDLENDDEIDGNAFINFGNPQVLHVKVTNDLTGCYSVAELTLEVSVTAANNAQLTACDNDGTEDGFYAFTLSGADASVLKMLPNGLSLFYYKTYEDALLENNPLPDLYTNTTAYSQNIYARVENNNACYGISEVALTVFKMPNIELEAEAIYCLNNFPEQITLSAGVIDDSPNDYSYSWSTGEISSEIRVNMPGTYSVRVTNRNGCFRDRLVTVRPSNIATIVDIKITDASQNNTITIFVKGEGNYQYALDLIGPYQESPIFENVSPGFHTVFVRDINGCGLTKDLVSVIGFPKYFTPNNDGINDLWQVDGINSQFQPKSTIYIFNRMGKLLKELDPLSSGWDGTFIGNHMPSDDYWFSITLQDGRVYKGHFTLKR